MNNTINNVNNVAFNSRYINVDYLEKVPPRIKEAILKSPAIDEFVAAGKPKTLFGKILVFFKKDEVIEVTHNVRKECNNPDIYAQDEFVIFSLRPSNRSFSLHEFQKGVARKAGSVPKLGEHPRLKQPEITSTEKLARAIEKIKDFDSLLK